MRIIINNKANLEAKIALLIVERVKEKEEISKFHDYRFEGKSYTCVYRKNKGSESFNIYLTNP